MEVLRVEVELLKASSDGAAIGVLVAAPRWISFMLCLADAGVGSAGIEARFTESNDFEVTGGRFRDGGEW